MDNGQLWSRFAAVHKRAVTVLLSLNGTRFNAARGLAPRIYEGGSPYSRQHSNFHVIPNQSSDWCGNPRRTADCIPIFMSFRTSSLSWCGNLPRHCDRILLTMEIATPVCALARNDANKRPHSQKRVIPNQFSFLVWESPPSLRPLSSIDGDCHASVRTGSQRRGIPWCAGGQTPCPPHL